MNLKLQRGIRVYASNYLQENLLSLPALPSREKLKEIRAAKEEEAERRKQEILRQKEEQRRLLVRQIVEHRIHSTELHPPVLSI